MNTGKAVILAVLTMAVAAASYAWWHQLNRGRHVLQLWGADAAWLIRHSDQVQLWRLQSGDPQQLTAADGDASEPAAGDAAGRRLLIIDGVPYVVRSSRDISAAPGIQHARQALIEDVSYDWRADSATVRGTWQVALIFAAPRGEVTLLLDLDNQLIRRADDGATPTKLTISDGLRQFIEEQWDPPGNTDHLN